MRLSVHVITNNRHNTLALLLESLRKQSFKEWDLVVLDNNREVKITQDYMISCLFNRLQYEGHRIHVIDNSKDEGSRDVGRYRNMVVDGDPFAAYPYKKDQNRTNEIGVRVDDDSVLEANFLEILAHGFTNNYLGVGDIVGIVGGICPYFFQPVTHAPLPAKFNQVNSKFDWTDHCVYFFRMLDEKGNDRHWTTTFYESGHIRSNYAYRIDLAKNIKWPEYTGHTGFTEETTFCVKAWMLGYKVLINPNAIAWHLAYPSGGGRELFDPAKAQEQMEEIKVRNLAALKEDLTKFRSDLKLEERSYP